MLPHKLFAHLKHSLPIIFLSCALTLTLGIPLGITMYRAVPVWLGVPPSHIEDSVYYYSRIKAATTDGVYFTNSAYQVSEDTPASSFAISEWLAGIPYALTHSWGVTIVWNNLVWPLLTVLFLFLFFGELGISKWAQAIGTYLTFLQMLLLFERPVIMQIPFVAFALLLWCSSLWLRRTDWRTTALFGFVLAFVVLSWVFMASIAALVCMGIATYLFVLRDWVRFWWLVRVGTIAALLVFPVIVPLLPAFSDPSYFGMLEHFGLVLSHIPSLDAWYYGRWLVLLGLIVLVTECANAWSIRKLERGALVTLIFTASFLVGLCIPVFTGSDLNVGSHIGRFVFPMVAIGVVYVLDRMYAQKRFASISIYAHAFVLCVVLLLVFALGINIVKRNIPRIPTAQAFAEYEAYAAPLSFLESREPVPVVIQANSTISELIPLVTKHQVLFVQYGGYYIVPEQEIMERYVTSKFPGRLTIESLKSEASSFDLGAATYLVQVDERAYTLCELVQKILPNHKACVKPRTYTEIRGDGFFNTYLETYNKEVLPHISTYYAKYKVAYVIVDTRVDSMKSVPTVYGSRVYSDGRFDIYQTKLD